MKPMTLPQRLEKEGLTAWMNMVDAQLAAIRGVLEAKERLQRQTRNQIVRQTEVLEESLEVLKQIRRNTR